MSFGFSSIYITSSRDTTACMQNAWLVLHLELNSPTITRTANADCLTPIIDKAGFIVRSDKKINADFAYAQLQMQAIVRYQGATTI